MRSPKVEGRGIVYEKIGHTLNLKQGRSSKSQTGLREFSGADEEEAEGLLLCDEHWGGRNQESSL